MPTEAQIRKQIADSKKKLLPQASQRGLTWEFLFFHGFLANINPNCTLRDTATKNKEFLEEVLEDSPEKTMGDLMEGMDLALREEGLYEDVKKLGKFKTLKEQTKAYRRYLGVYIKLRMMGYGHDTLTQSGQIK